jgi:hypothetical protein
MSVAATGDAVQQEDIQVCGTPPGTLLRVKDCWSLTNRPEDPPEISHPGTSLPTQSARTHCTKQRGDKLPLRLRLRAAPGTGQARDMVVGLQHQRTSAKSAPELDPGSTPARRGCTAASLRSPMLP